MTAQNKAGAQKKGGGYYPPSPILELLGLNWGGGDIFDRGVLTPIDSDNACTWPVRCTSGQHLGIIEWDVSCVSFPFHCAYVRRPPLYNYHAPPPLFRTPAAEASRPKEAPIFCPSPPPSLCGLPTLMRTAALKCLPGWVGTWYRECECCLLAMQQRSAHAIPTCKLE